MGSTPYRFAGDAMSFRSVIGCLTLFSLIGCVPTTASVSDPGDPGVAPVPRAAGGNPPPPGAFPPPDGRLTADSPDWVTKTTSFTASQMLLLTDGRLMVQTENAPQWSILTPGADGTYRNGTWSSAAPMSKGRMYFASAVLSDGRVVVLGGEYAGDLFQADDATAEIYDPQSNSWSLITAPPGWSQIGDAASVLLPDGRLLLGSLSTNDTELWDPKTQTLSSAGTKLDPAEEESWVLLADGSVLTIDCTRFGKSERWTQDGGWQEAGDLPIDMVEVSSQEIGPAFLLGDGRALFIGATGHTAFYESGAWKQGPDLPLDQGQQAVSKDAPGVLLQNGHVLVTASQEGASGWGGPTNFYDVDTSVSPMKMLQVGAPSNSGQAPYEGRLIMLPSGEVAYTQGSPQISFRTAAVTPTLKAPAITVSPATATAGGTFVIQGRLFNGVSQTSMYGDDAQQATNYPLVRLTKSGVVTYARTFDHSTMGVATGTAVVSTHVMLPATLAVGTYQMQVVANGIASPAVSLKVTGGTISCSGCVDGAGFCETGASDTSCGAGGNACTSCGLDQTCVNGVCKTGVCTGCKDASGTCEAGDSDVACGAGGNLCQACAPGYSCVGGACQLDSCAGCMSAGFCQTGTTTTACGIGGNVCVACGTNQNCVNGMCQANSTCTGCMSSGSCHAGTTTAACGAGGNVCIACASGQKCVSGMCQSATACAGCVGSTGTCRAGTTKTSCGSAGNACVTCPSADSCINGACVPTVACAHPDCSAGAALNATCNTCVAKICAADSYCCTGSWDATCVGEVKTVCNLTTCQTTTCAGCTSSTGTCRAGTTTTSCGTGGAACVTCPSGHSCVSGQCQ
jgi:hypothetical protein